MTRSWAQLCNAGEHLLHRWAHQGDDRAFAELVRREVKAEGRSVLNEVGR